ncbi:MAG: hypothetical protein LAQ30_10155, partial [Acidobacteriia bacterium]|nr:hypothetical protein [Terriglobia bacterium]
MPRLAIAPPIIAFSPSRWQISRATWLVARPPRREHSGGGARYPQWPPLAGERRRFRGDQFAGIGFLPYPQWPPLAGERRRFRGDQFAGIGFLPQFLQRDPEVGHGLKAVCAVLAEAAPDHFFQVVWDLGAERRRFLGEDGRQRGGSRFLLKRPPAGDHFVEHGPEAENVRTGVQGLAFGLLRRHVGHRPFLRGGAQRARGFVPAARRLSQLGQSEIEHLHQPVLVHHEVAGLQVAVHDARRVRPAERIRDLHAVPERLAQLQPFAPDQLVQRAALDVLHGDVVHAVLPVDVVDVNDIGVAQRRGGLGFLHEAPLALGVGHFVRRQNFNRDEAVEVGVARLVDHAHTTLAEGFEDLIVRNRSAGHLVLLPGFRQPDVHPDFGLREEQAVGRGGKADEGLISPGSEPPVFRLENQEGLARGFAGGLVEGQRPDGYAIIAGPPEEEVQHPAARRPVEVGLGAVAQEGPLGLGNGAVLPMRRDEGALRAGRAEREHDPAAVARDNRVINALRVLQQGSG